MGTWWEPSGNLMWTHWELDGEQTVTYNKNPSAGKGYGNTLGTCWELNVNTWRTWWGGKTNGEIQWELQCRQKGYGNTLGTCWELNVNTWRTWWGGENKWWNTMRIALQAKRLWEHGGEHIGNLMWTHGELDGGNELIVKYNKKLEVGCWNCHHYLFLVNPPILAFFCQAM